MSTIPFESIDSDTLFVEVILPLFIPKTYTYRVPKLWNDKVKPGVRVIVQFGKTRLYAGIIDKLTEKAPERYEAKYILDVVDEQPVVLPNQVAFWRWISDYYMCYLGEVMQAALPAALKLASETKITAKKQEEVDRSGLSDKAFMIMEALDVAGELKISDVVKLLDQKNVFPILKSLFNEGYILISEEVKERYKPKMQTVISLNEELVGDQGKLAEALDSLNRAPKQQDALMTYIQMSRTKETISRTELVQASGAAASSIKSLVEKGIFVAREEEISRLGKFDVDEFETFELTESQATAFKEVQDHFTEKDVVLLHGITASGKTQVYIRLIESHLENGGVALFLLPEIALTTQLTQRLKKYFGNDLAVYHSKFNDQERMEVWNKVLAGEVRVVIGARSAVFLPFKDLKLVVVDEEHETTYKQFEPSPRYHGRDAAIYLAHLYGAKVLLGSATPSIESYYNAKAGKYGLVEMNVRYGKSKLPELHIIDMQKHGKKGEVISYFSKPLLDAIEGAVKQKQQVILFQNRRGHTTISQCGTCGHVVRCTNCDVSLTYHKSTSLMHCHYCGYTEEPSGVCVACGTPSMLSKGVGTERIEEELELLMPELRIGRLDIDSAKGKHGFENIISDFDSGLLDVLIGTQMVAKGLDFGNVSVIGIINADAIINFPDFRSYERAFSLFSQVAGRAGRRDIPGQVYIQTATPKHRILKQVSALDYGDMFHHEITERKNFFYPPFYRLIKIIVRHNDRNLSHQGAHLLANLLRGQLAGRVLGPEPPLVSRVRNQFIQEIHIKIERRDISLSKVKEFILETVVHYKAQKKNPKVQILMNVDPY